MIEIWLLGDTVSAKRAKLSKADLAAVKRGLEQAAKGWVTSWDEIKAQIHRDNAQANGGVIKRGKRRKQNG
jgi:predicted transcriptional regulator